jgi:hypothetical protein
MAAATKYQCILTLFNLFLLAIGATLIAYGIDKVSPDWDKLMEGLFSPHIWPLSTFAGSALVALAVLGCVGSCRAKRNIVTNSCSCALGLYGTAIFVSLAATGLIVALSGGYIHALNNEVDMGYDANNTSSIDLAVMDTLTANPEEWYSLQNSESCCGWGELDDSLATGIRCAVNPNATDPVDQTCRDKLIVAGTNAIWIILTTSAVTFFILFVVLSSVCCLTCCSKPQDAVDDQGYQRMPGGQARGAGYV